MRRGRKVRDEAQRYHFAPEKNDVLPQVTERKEGEENRETLRLFPVFVLLMLKTRRGKVRTPRTASVGPRRHADENTPSFLAALRAPLLKNYWHKATGPCKTLILGTRADRRLFKTELFFLIYVEQYLFFFLCLYMNVLM